MKSLVICLLVILFAVSSRADPVPAIARLAGVHVGETTMESLDRRLGPTRGVVDGEPVSFHDWRSRQTGWRLHADGVYHRGHARVIDNLSVYNAAGQTDIPTTNLPRPPLLFLGQIAVGMRRAEVERLIAGGLPPPKTRDEVNMVWEVENSPGASHRLHQIIRWAATLTFNQDRRVQNIEITAVSY